MQDFTVYCQKIFRTWLTEIQQSDWLVTVVKNSTDHTVKNCVLKNKQ